MDLTSMLTLLTEYALGLEWLQNLTSRPRSGS
jgi:hypothetical protein